jgi:hypothetical protein
MSTVPIPQGATIDPVQASGTVPIPAGATVDSPDQPGQLTNDVGNTVVVPKDGENFSDTVKRAVSRQNALSPQQKQTEIDREAATIPAKTAQTLAGAAAIGVAGPAALAAPGEVVSAIRAMPGATEAVLQHLEEHAAATAKAYPNLVSLAGKLGIPTGIGALLVYLAKQSK